MSSTPRPVYDGSAQGGNARSGARATAGNGTAGNVKIRAGTRVPNGDFKMSGKGGDATSTGCGAAKGGNGKGGSFTFGA